MRLQGMGILRLMPKTVNIELLYQKEGYAISLLV